MMRFTQSNANLYIPDSADPATSFSRTTHLGVGAHQDDLEFMAMHGILACYDTGDKWFGGITCTDGAGSARTGRFAEFTDEQMKAIRVEEQRTAARVGQYAFMAQLGHPSCNAKDPARREVLIADLHALLLAAQPTVVYTHNPFDKHATHIGVLLALLEAIRRLPAPQRPAQVLGCEVWRALDWLPDDLKVVQDVSARPELARELNGIFESQIAGGKRYDLAVEGRRLANATFLESHATDTASRVSLAVDLTALTADNAPSPMEFVRDTLRRFDAAVTGLLAKLS